MQVQRSGFAIVWALAVFYGLSAWAQGPAGDPAPAEDAAAVEQVAPATASGAAVEETPLARRQQQVLARFQELLTEMLRTAEATSGADARRAALLKQAFAQSSDRQLVQKLERVVALLGEDQLFAATKDQAEIERELAKLLELLLSGDRDRQIASEKQRVAAILKQVNQIIKEQKGIQGQTAGDGDPAELSQRQEQLAGKTGELAKSIKKDEEAEKADAPADAAPRETPAPGGEKPAEGAGESPAEEGADDPKAGPPGASPPAPSENGDQAEPTEGQPAGEEPQPARKRIEAAEQRMQDAQKKLEEAQRKDAVDEQEKAIEELELAKAELERILRQLREEEVERVLAMLESRFRAMLQMQIEVHAGTQRLDKKPFAEREHDDEIEAGRLGRREAEIVTMADKALAVMREEGSAVAMPEAVGQMRADMQQVVAWLGQGKVDLVTQGIEEEIITAIEEMIAAIQTAQQQPMNVAAGGMAGEMTEPPLVDQIAELKMIRTLEARVRTRTDRFNKLWDAGDASREADLQAALAELAGRHERILRATRDIVTGRNE